MCQSLYSSDNESKKNSVPEEKMKVESLMKNPSKWTPLVVSSTPNMKPR